MKKKKNLNNFGRKNSIITFLSYGIGNRYRVRIRRYRKAIYKIGQIERIRKHAKKTFKSRKRRRIRKRREHVRS